MDDNSLNDVKEISTIRTFSFRTYASVLKHAKPADRTQQIKWAAGAAAQTMKSRGMETYSLEVTVLTAVVVPEEMEPELFDAFEVTAIATFIKAG